MSAVRLKAERQEEILQLLSRRGALTVPDLAVNLRVSQVTVRRDLDELEKSGRLARVHGGATRPLPVEPEPPVLQRLVEQAHEKRAIGMAAADLIADGDIVAITSGSTALELARAVAARPWQKLHVVTNSFVVASALSRTPGVELLFVGGRVNPDEMGTFGVLADEMLRRLNVDRLFLGCRGIDPRAGLSNDEQAEIASDRAFAAASRQVIVLADHTKFGQVFAIRIIPTRDIHVIVTDCATPAHLLEHFHDQGIRVVAAPASQAGIGGDGLDVRAASASEAPRDGRV